LIDQVLRGERVTLRPVRPSDAGDLRAIFSDPAVAQWWGDVEGSMEDALDTSEDGAHFVIEVGGEPAGYIQAYEETDPMYRHAGIDISLRGPWQGKGLGPEAIRVLARHLIDERGHHRLIIDPAAHNTNAIKAYERVGFRRVGLMRRYERGPNGEWHDGLLMDMLADELLD
jgi:aminoglycoside 6'-N-acetyltransferase